jgi:hypothetical protein
MSIDPFTIELRGHIAAKKNNWRPRKGGGIVLDKDARTAIDRLAMQIPGHIRDLHLESPDIEFIFSYERANWDRDNAVTTLLDILVQMGTLVDDNIRRCNGRITIHPAIQGWYDGVNIVVTPQGNQSHSGYKVK